eukprot:795227-Prymnesium_polylepis.1
MELCSIIRLRTGRKRSCSESTHRRRPGLPFAGGRYDREQRTSDELSPELSEWSDLRILEIRSLINRCHLEAK